MNREIQERRDMVEELRLLTRPRTLQEDAAGMQHRVRVEVGKVIVLGHMLRESSEKHSVMGSDMRRQILVQRSDKPRKGQKNRVDLCTGKLEDVGADVSNASYFNTYRSVTTFSIQV